MSKRKVQGFLQENYGIDTNENERDSAILSISMKHHRDIPTEKNPISSIANRFMSWREHLVSIPTEELTECYSLAVQYHFGNEDILPKEIVQAWNKIQVKREEEESLLNREKINSTASNTKYCPKCFTTGWLIQPFNAIVREDYDPVSQSILTKRKMIEGCAPCSCNFGKLYLSAYSKAIGVEYEDPEPETNAEEIF